MVKNNWQFQMRQLHKVKVLIIKNLTFSFYVKYH